MMCRFVVGWLAALLAPSALVHAAAPACRIDVAGPPPQVVELYTSEGCDSCPPADRWLSSLHGRDDVIAAAFHVDYWDRLGWRDRFASARFTQRQAQAQAHSGVNFSYTPQVLVGGRDWRRWPALPAAAPAAARVRLTLQREGDRVQWQAQPLDGGSTALALWWAVLEDGHLSEVKAGENAGATLRHDHVVRDLGRVPPWRGSATQSFEAPLRGEGGRPVRVIAVVTDATSGAPVQAAQLRCPG